MRSCGKTRRTGQTGKTGQKGWTSKNRETVVTYIDREGGREGGKDRHKP